MNARFGQVTAIVFDLDDTLCGYWDAAKAGLTAAFVQHGPPDHSAAECQEAWAQAFRAFSPVVKNSEWYDTYLKDGGATRLEQMRRTLAVMGVEDEERAQRLADTYGSVRDSSLQLFNDAIPVLTALKERCPLALLTNGPADVQRQEVATLGIEGWFEHIFIEGEMGKGKPHPEVMALVEQSFSARGREVLMIGNSYAHDIRPALERGWAAVWILRDSDVAPSAKGPEGRPEGAPEPDAVIHSLSELLPLLNS